VKNIRVIFNEESVSSAFRMPSIACAEREIQLSKLSWEHRLRHSHGANHRYNTSATTKVIFTSILQFTFTSIALSAVRQFQHVMSFLFLLVLWHKRQTLREIPYDSPTILTGALRWCPASPCCNNLWNTTPACQYIARVSSIADQVTTLRGLSYNFLIPHRLHCCDSEPNWPAYEEHTPLAAGGWRPTGMKLASKLLLSEVTYEISTRTAPLRCENAKVSFRNKNSCCYFFILNVFVLSACKVNPLTATYFFSKTSYNC